MNKGNPFPALTAPFSLTFLSRLFFAFEAIPLTNPGKLFLTISTIVNAFLPKVPN